MMHFVNTIKLLSLYTLLCCWLMWSIAAFDNKTAAPVGDI